MSNMFQKSIWSLLDRQSHENLWFLTDAQAAAVVPIICYWILSGFYEFCIYFNLFSQHYIYEDKDEKKKNLVSRGRVLTVVLVMQAVQISFALYMIRFNTENVTGEGGFGTLLYFSDLLDSMELVNVSNLATAALVLRILYLLFRQVLAVFLFDTWAYWIHYAEHKNTWLYRNIHSVHHQNYVPFCFAASYNHPLEGFFNDILGPYIAAQCVGLSDRESAFFFTFATIKAVDDHCGIQLPWNPITFWGRLTGNGLIYHNVHHQTWGLKKNFGLYFTFWDRLVDTQYTGTRTLGKLKQ